MTETPFFFPNGDAWLFGFLHQPESPSRLPLVFCHPFGEEKLWAHRVYVTFARRLAALGHPVLRFDYMGNGDSGGDFQQSSLTSAIADVKCAIDEIRRRTGAQAVALLGLRLGATIASLVAEEVPDVDAVVLWAPIVDGARYMQELLRVNLTTQMATYKEIREDREALAALMKAGRTVNVDGYELAHQMFAEVSAVNLVRAPMTFAGRSLVVHIDRQPDRPASEPTRLTAGYRRGTLSTAQEEPFWKEIPRFYQQAPNLFAATLAWLVAADAGGLEPEPAAER